VECENSNYQEMEPEQNRQSTGGNPFLLKYLLTAVFVLVLAVDIFQLAGAYWFRKDNSHYA